METETFHFIRPTDAFWNEKKKHTNAGNSGKLSNPEDI